jgi:hypothetical protein
MQRFFPERNGIRGIRRMHGIKIIAEGEYDNFEVFFIARTHV